MIRFVLAIQKTYSDETRLVRHAADYLDVAVRDAIDLCDFDEFVVGVWQMGGFQSIIWAIESDERFAGITRA